MNTPLGNPILAFLTGVVREGFVASRDRFGGPLRVEVEFVRGWGMDLA
jgi:hypothetical protein